MSKKSKLTLEQRLDNAVFGPAKNKPFKFKPDKRVDGKASPSNAERAARAESALTSYEGFEDDEPHLSLQDFLSDAMHLCDREGWDFDDVLRMASGNWNAER